MNATGARKRMAAGLIHDCVILQSEKMDFDDYHAGDIVSIFNKLKGYRDDGCSTLGSRRNQLTRFRNIAEL